MSQHKVLVSACLLGERVRYDGSSRPVAHDILEQWKAEQRIVSVCPETLGGLLVPRPAAEIESGFDGQDIVQEKGKVITKQGHNLSQYFVRGARRTLDIANGQDIKVAILKANSPSCGNEHIYDGQFARQTKSGMGVTVATLIGAGIKVFNEHQLDAAQAYLLTLETIAEQTQDSTEAAI
ncbi:Uncharacterized conserved protein YbbK, DUF523 family [Oceanospirillum multiglobuliferum]|uniref:Uncharacterized protein n=1 Tax=Oceanospirillum multiglobuliferum TaxID=64969 RepID=A0A1T4SAL8_9GAMM|nr:DUF523 domain-containing protein [Oceanospirillum multiglobuliferum]OPX54356.1 hypothetical protein BTE48_14530 [Oceanospirillum multiglobuliferum]SKA24891.1 Uncharacterized conserved protein YbbK, DUF523 family [Oceanospirillum multiglobuliferum]